MGTSGRHSSSSVRSQQGDSFDVTELPIVVVSCKLRPRPASATGSPAASQAQESKSPNEKIQVGCIGVNGKGESDVRNVSEFGKIYALCDVDSTFLDGTAKKYKTEHNFADFREMLDKMGDRIDAVTVSIPDHNHAVAAAKAMKMGKHVYCQKPLTHTIWEARRLGEIAKETGVATQMGNQYTALNSMRKAAATDSRRATGHGERSPRLDEPADLAAGRTAGRRSKPVPANVNWEAWLGPAPFRPYADGYHPFAWRGWWDFGTGALGDMACHTCNLPYMALDLRDPIAVEAECAEHNQRQLSEVVEDQVRIPEIQGSGGVHDALVRRRQAAAERAVRKGHARRRRTTKARKFRRRARAAS